MTEDFRTKALQAYLAGTSFSSGFQTVELEDASESEEEGSAEESEEPAVSEVTEEEFTIEAAGEDSLLIKDAEGNPFAEFGMVSVRRYSGEVSME